MPEFEQCNDCTKRYLRLNCPYNDIDRKTQEFLKSEKIPFTCNAYNQRPPPPPPMTEVEYLVEVEKLLIAIPQEFKETLAYMAYEKGHAYGYEEIICVLKNLISDLKPAIDKFQARLLSVRMV